jgi:hypothetical protein
VLRLDLKRLDETLSRSTRVPPSWASSITGPAPRWSRLKVNSVTDGWVSESTIPCSTRRARAFWTPPRLPCLTKRETWRPLKGRAVWTRTRSTQASSVGVTTDNPFETSIP